MSDEILPPRKRDWKPGDHQLGLFIRFPGGEQIAVTINTGKLDEIKAAVELLRLVTRKESERTAVAVSDFHCRRPAACNDFRCDCNCEGCRTMRLGRPA